MADGKELDRDGIELLKPRCKALARRRGDSVGSAVWEDAFQDAFIEAWKWFKGGGYVTPSWFMKQFDRQLNKALGKERKRHNRILDAAQEGVGIRGRGDAECSADAPPDARLLSQERRRMLIRSVRRAGLQRADRCALWARVRERIPEVAQRLGISTEALRKRAERALNRLKRHVPAELGWR